MPTPAEPEIFLPGAKTKSDAELMEMPDPPYGPPVMFLATCEALLTNLTVDTRYMIQNLQLPGGGAVRAINCNYGHIAAPGMQRYLKLHRKPPKIRAGAPAPIIRTRKMQGDGTCFNSALEPVVCIVPDAPPLAPVYFLKCFTTTGQTQVPGTLLPDLSDGLAAIEAWVRYLNIEYVAITNAKNAAEDKERKARFDALIAEGKLAEAAAVARIVVAPKTAAATATNTTATAPKTAATNTTTAAATKTATTKTVAAVPKTAATKTVAAATKTVAAATKTAAAKTAAAPKTVASRAVAAPKTVASRAAAAPKTVASRAAAAPKTAASKTSVVAKAAEKTIVATKPKTDLVRINPTISRTARLSVLAAPFTPAASHAAKLAAVAMPFTAVRRYEGHSDMKFLPGEATKTSTKAAPKPQSHIKMPVFVPHPTLKEIEIRNFRANLINFKFRLRRTSPRILLNLELLGDFLRVLELNARQEFVARLQKRNVPEPLPFPGGCVLPATAPPLAIREVKLPKEEGKMSFCSYVTPDRMVRVNIFQQGKINILGANRMSSGEILHRYITEIFAANWNRFVRLQPRPDAYVVAAPVPAPARTASGARPPTDPDVAARAPSPMVEYHNYLDEIIADTNEAANVAVNAVAADSKGATSSEQNEGVATAGVAPPEALHDFEVDDDMDQLLKKISEYGEDILDDVPGDNVPGDGKGDD